VIFIAIEHAPFVEVEAFPVEVQDPIPLLGVERLSSFVAPG
jgi:hypothetical protein